MTPSTESTAVAMFDDYSAAENAVRKLRNEGIPESAVQINSNLRTSSAGQSGSYDDATATGDSGHESGFMGWWHRTFGTGDDNPTTHDYGSHYSEAIRRGNAVVTVTLPQSQLDRAVEILDAAGAVDIDQRLSDYRQSGYTGYNADAPAYSYDEASSERQRFAGQNAPIPVVEEELKVGKRQVQRGGVRVYSRVVEQPVQEDIRLREEHVRVERRPVDRALTDADLANLKDQSVEVTEMAEEAVVSKQARVREEVVVGKDVTERVEHVQDTVRRTEVEVENLEGTRKNTRER